MQPFASIVFAALKSRASPIATMRPAATATSQTLSSFDAGSITRPFWIRSFILLCLVACDDAHDRHSHRDAEGDLRQDHALLAVDHRRIDFDAAVDRPRM